MSGETVKRIKVLLVDDHDVVRQGLRRVLEMEPRIQAADLDVTSWGQLALKFIAAEPAVTCIIPATGKLEHLMDNLGGGRGRLPDERQREAIAQAFA